MAQDLANERVTIRDLGDGLVIRLATVADTEELAAFNANIHRMAGATEPDEGIAGWTRELMKGDHPTVSASDNLLVEDTRTGAIVSTANLISQTWSYGGIPFGVGRPELVGTLPDYRNRGLVRAQFEVIHRWSAERGELVQAITGIPYYYRLFGYEMALQFDALRLGYKPHVPVLKEGDPEPYRFRPATDDDIPFLSEVYAHSMQRAPVACLRDERIWKYELHGRDDASTYRRIFQVIEHAGSGEPVGVLDHPARLNGTVIICGFYELKPGVSWLAVTPSVLRYLWATGKQYAECDKKQEVGGFAFMLGTEHPVYEVAHELLPRVRPPYAWYIRVPDLPAFIRHISPVLEQRLADSPAVGHTGELKISFFRDGLRLVFDKGRISAESWRPTPEDQGSAAFPDLSFLRLLFGHASQEDLRAAYADCNPGTGEARVLLKYLFPKQTSNVWALG
ncbi:MAG: GNAT family N-acetyltransferase [Chloroflexia bacterium]